MNREQLRRPVDGEEADLKSLLAEAERFKRLTFFGILVCTVATLTASLCVPMLYSYVQFVQSSLRDELSFCTHKTQNLFSEFDKFESVRRPKRSPIVGQFIMNSHSLSKASLASDESARPRSSRQGGYQNVIAGYSAAGQQPLPHSAFPTPAAAPIPQPSAPVGYGPVSGAVQQPAPAVDTPAPTTPAPATQPPEQPGYGPQTNEASFAPQKSVEEHPTEAVEQPQQCCSCGIGPAGPPGQPGTDGNNGQDGQPGAPGEAGQDVQSQPAAYQAEPCFDCPAAQPGAAGGPGPKGVPGPPGLPGQPGIPGSPGPQGPVGTSGPQGGIGQAGQPGQRGPEGQLADLPGTQGPPGSSGPPGAPGQPGQPGPSGKSQNGPPGPPGDAGPPGSPGNPGQAGQKGPDGEGGGKGGCDHCPAPRTAPGY